VQIVNGNDTQRNVLLVAIKKQSIPPEGSLHQSPISDQII